MEMYILFLFTAAALFFDLRKSRIPNWLNASGAAAGLLYHLWNDGWSGAWFSMIGMVTGFSILFVLYLARAVGAGDVKLFGAIGAIVGFHGALYIAVYSLFLTFPIGVIVLVFRKRFLVFLRTLYYWVLELALWKRRPNAAGYEWARIPFMIAVAPGVALASPFVSKTFFL
jgi:prepilin peptidase CpaA